MVFSYYPGCTLKTKAKDLDKYAHLSAQALGVELEELPGSAAAVFILWQAMKLLLSFHPSERWHQRKQREMIL
jgi:heterodisulfide reductase subunit B